MRILHALPSVDLAMGGPIEAVLATVPHLRERGHELEILCLDRGDEPYIAACPVKTHAVGTGKGGYGYSARFVPWLKDHRAEYDHVVVDGIWQYHSVGTEEALRGTDTPYYVYPHGMLDPWFRRRYPLKHLKKQVFWLLRQHRVLNRAKAVLFTCEEERLVARNGFFPYRFREKVVPFGTQRPEKRREECLQAFRDAFPQLDKPFVLYLSRIHEKKGIDLLVRAYEVMAKNAPFDVVIAGPDQAGLGKKLQAECERLGIAGRFHWVGMVRGDAKYGAFYAAEASILPSHQENFGITVAESLACGCPVLISNKVNIWREIAGDDAGLVEDDTLEGTLELLKGWTATPPERRRQMAENAVRCFDSRFEIGRSVLSYLE